MQFKGSFAKALLMALTLSLIPLSAFSAPKITAGSSCKVLNQKAVYQSKTYTCIKSGKKLVWGKGVATKPTLSPKPAPTPIATPKVDPFVPWSAKFEIDSLVKSALDSTNAYQQDVRPDNSYDAAIQDTVSESDRKWIVQMLDYSNGFFSKVERKKLSVFLGNSHEWSKEKMKAAGVWVGDPNGKYPCSNGTQDAYCSGYSNIVLMIYLNQSRAWDINGRATPAHEVFHTIQHSLMGYNAERFPPGHPQAIPRWLKEGSASYFGYYIVEKLGYGAYKNSRDSIVRLNPEYRNAKPLASYDDYESNPYGIGQAATEFIIASVGFENLLNIFKFSGTEGSFSAGFKKATGLEIGDFHAKFEEARSSMQIGS
jgi:hypothetical protein